MSLWGKVIERAMGLFRQSKLCPGVGFSPKGDTQHIVTDFQVVYRVL